MGLGEDTAALPWAQPSRPPVQRCQHRAPPPEPPPAHLSPPCKCGCYSQLQAGARTPAISRGVESAPRARPAPTTPHQLLPGLGEGTALVEQQQSRSPPPAQQSTEPEPPRTPLGPSLTREGPRAPPQYSLRNLFPTDARPSHLLHVTSSRQPFLISPQVHELTQSCKHPQPFAYVCST